MKMVWKLVGRVVKAAVVIAGIVVAVEAVDLLQERERCRYLVDQDFED